MMIHELGHVTSRMLRYASKCLAAGVLLSLLSACSPAEDSPSLHIGTNVWPGYEPLYLARDLGYFDELAIHMVEYTSAEQVMRAFRNETINAACITLDEALLLLQQGFSPRLVLVMDVSAGGDVILGQKQITRLIDLRGHRVGVEANALGAYMLSRALDAAGLQLNDITPVAVEVNQHEAAFLQQDVDAIVTFEPVSSRLLAKGATQLFDSSQIPGEIVDVLVVREQYLQDNQAEVRQLINSWYRALHYLRDNPNDAAQRMSRRLQLQPSEVLTAYEGLILPQRQQTLAMLTSDSSGNESQLLDSARRLANVMVQRNLLPTPTDPKNLMLSRDIITRLLME